MVAACGAEDVDARQVRIGAESDTRELLTRPRQHEGTIAGDLVALRIVPELLRHQPATVFRDDDDLATGFHVSSA